MEDHQSERKTKGDPIPPDGGWGWVVAAGCFVSTGLPPMIIQVFSIVYSKLFRDNNTSTILVAWVLNLGQTIWNIGTFMLPILCSHYGWRKVAFMGGLFIAISPIASSFIEKAQMLLLTHSLVYGIGGGLVVGMYNLIIPRYFEKRRGRVLGLMSSALCSGQFVAPLLIKNLQETYGHRGTLLIMGAVLFNVCAAALLFHPVEWHCKNSRRASLLNQDLGEREKCISDKETNAMKEKSYNTLTTQNHPRYSPKENGEGSLCEITTLSLQKGSLQSEYDSQQIGMTENGLREASPAWTNKRKNNRWSQVFSNEIKSIANSALHNLLFLKYARVFIITFSHSLTISLYLNFYMLLPFSVLQKGLDMKVAAYCLTTAGILNALTRLLISSLTDAVQIDPKWYFMTGSLMISGSIFSFSCLSDQKLLMMVMGFYGMGIGCCVCTFPFLIIRVMGMKLLPPTLGTKGLASLILYPTLGPLIGYIRDQTQDYDLCLKILAAINLIAFILWSIMPLAIKFDNRKKLSTQTDDCIT